MRNIRLTIEYDGSTFCGWQTQNSHSLDFARDSLRSQATKSLPRLRSGLPSVAGHQKKAIQDTIERALQKILQEKIKLIASGRTDSGVHAVAQVANFKTHCRISLEKLHKAVNALLPDEISVIKVEEASPDFHSRFSAKSKIYRYTILNRPYRSSLLKNKVYFCPHPLDFKLMQKEAKVLLGRHDFSAFCASNSNVKDTIRTVKTIKIETLPYPDASQKDKPLIVIEIEADGFLYNMVRNILGTLIDIGRGRFKKGSLKRILATGDRKLAGPTAPACGLYLVKVKY
ncbi:MAG: tRNA pseudouridine(38-40) synthase TruA [Candidatus Omnitrophota bacterium]